MSQQRFRLFNNIGLLLNTSTSNGIHVHCLQMYYLMYTVYFVQTANDVNTLNRSRATGVPVQSKGQGHIAHCIQMYYNTPLYICHRRHMT